jgi:hypothetical protein
MKGFEVQINGKTVCKAGLPDDADLSLDAYKNKYEGMKLYMRGTVDVNEYRRDHYDWGNQSLAVGDEVMIRVIDAEVFDEPLEKRSSDPSSHNSEEYEKKMLDLMARYHVIAEREGVDALKPPKEEGVFCSFCGKSQQEQPKMCMGPARVYICVECVSRCSDILVSGGTWPRS